MTRELLIGIAGHKGVGKTTVSDMLVELIPDMQIVAWADVLKDEVMEMVNQYESLQIDRHEMERLKSEVYGPMLQGWGAFRRRYFGENYWIKAWDYRAGPRVIVPDCRHTNEVEYLQANGGKLIYIWGPSRWMNDTRSSEHESERFIAGLADRADYRIDNTVSKTGLRVQVESLVTELLKVVEDAGVPA